MKLYAINAFKVIVFCLVMFLLGASTAEPFQADTRGLAFVCSSLVIIIAWCELKKTMLSIFKRSN